MRSVHIVAKHGIMRSETTDKEKDRTTQELEIRVLL